MGPAIAWLSPSRLTPQAVRTVVATYNETREPDAQGRPGRVTARQLVSVFVDGYPVLRPYTDLREALGDAYRVVSFSRAAGPTWHQVPVGSKRPAGLGAAT